MGDSESPPANEDSRGLQSQEMEIGSLSSSALDSRDRVAPDAAFQAHLIAREAGDATIAELADLAQRREADKLGKCHPAEASALGPKTRQWDGP
jgi:hypothetical protein